jgi:hypothetical protein
MYNRHCQCTILSVHHPSTWSLPNAKKVQKQKREPEEKNVYKKMSPSSQQRVVATVEESVLKMEMAGLESQEEDAPQRILFFKPMSWLGKISPHRRDESWSGSL